MCGTLGEHTHTKIDFSNVVQIAVGPNNNIFYIPRKLFCQRSSLFREAGAATWPLAHLEHELLPKTKPEILSVYIQMLLTGKIVGVLNEEGDDENDMDDDCWLRLVKLYLLARKLEDTEGADSIMGYMFRKLGTDLLGFVRITMPSSMPTSIPKKARPCASFSSITLSTR